MGHAAGRLLFVFTFFARILDCNSKCVKRTLWKDLEWYLAWSEQKHKFTHISINYSALKFFLFQWVLKSQQQQQNTELETAH